MRTVLVTGAGGAGRTTVAAATALTAARRGRRTLLLSADAGGTLEPALGTEPLPARDPAHEPAPETAPGTPARTPWGSPVEAAPGLWAARIDAAEHFRDEFLALQERTAAALDLLGATPLEREELTVLPGARHVALLRALRALHDAAAGWDVVVVDMPPAPETVAVLALPEQLRRYLRRLLPPERQAARALRPMLAQLAGVAMPAQWLYDTADRCERELAAAQRLLDSGATSVRIVVEAGPGGVDALRTARTGLALHGLAVDTVIVNRLLPTGSDDPWLAALSGRQQSALKELYEDCAIAHTVCELPHLGRDPRGLDDLDDLAARAVSTSLGGGTVGLIQGQGLGDHLDRPDGPRQDPWTVVDRRAEEGILLWRLPLPGAERRDLGLVRRGDELVITVGSFRRIVALPSALRRCGVSGARLADGVLHIRFTPDPALWPRTP